MSVEWKDKLGSGEWNGKQDKGAAWFVAVKPLDVHNWTAGQITVFVSQISDWVYSFNHIKCPNIRLHTDALEASCASPIGESR